MTSYGDVVKDEFVEKNKNISILFQFLKNNKEEQFLEYISNLSSEELDVNMRDSSGDYLISFAIIMNNRNILRKLLEYDCKIDVIDSDGHTLLYYPIKFNYIEILDILLDYDKKSIGISIVNFKDLRGAIPLFYAIKYKNYYALQLLLTQGADINYRNASLMNPLHIAVIKKDIVIVRMLLKYTKNINARTSDGSTALHYACNLQAFDIAKILLDAGASQSCMEYQYGMYPLFYAVIQNNIPLAKLLIDYHANPNNQDIKGNTVMHYCVVSKHHEILEYIFTKNKIHQDAIYYTEYINFSSVPSETKINPNLVNIDGLTILHTLIYEYHDNYNKYIEMLLPYTNLNYQDNIGNTVLHALCEKQIWMKFVDLLNQKKLAIYIKNNKGHTVLDYIRLQERSKFIKIVAKSYLNYLRKYQNDWLIEWQNSCSIIKEENMEDKKCIELIMNDINNLQISVPNRKNKKIIKIDDTDTVHFSTFIGSTLDVISGFKYLMKKYPFATYILVNTDNINPKSLSYLQTLSLKDENELNSNFEIRWIYQRIYFPTDFENKLAHIINSNTYRYIIIPVAIILQNGNHSNSLIYDIKNNVLERFEPHGSGFPVQFNYNPELLDEIIHKNFTVFISKIYDKNTEIKYLKPSNYIPKIGFQTFDSVEININKNIGDPNGFCTLWTIWYLDYRLKYHEYPPDKIIIKLIKEIRKNNLSFRSIVRNYSIIITNLRDFYLNLIQKNVNDYLNNRISQEELKKLYHYIVNDTTIIN